MSNNFKGNAALLITAIVWGSGFIAQKLGGEAMPPMSFNATRQLMASIALIPFAYFSVRSNEYFSKEKNTSSQIGHKIKWLIAAAIVCGGFLVVSTDLQQIGLATVSAGKSGFITVTYVVFVPLIGMFIGQKASKKAFLCAALALVGFAVMSLRFDGGMSKGDWLTLLSAIVFSGQMLAVNHFVDDGNYMVLSVVQSGFCGISGLIVGILVESPTLASFQAALPLLLYATFVPSCIGYTCQIIGQKFTDSTTAALILSLEAVFAALFGAIFLGESMSIREVAGSVIIFAAVIIAQIGSDAADATEGETENS
ncbi:MAG: DMT family transporter [Mogibacterium sp.]|nr:DMT family transporter [Mogibacterium sp.]